MKLPICFCVFVVFFLLVATSIAGQTAAVDTSQNQPYKIIAQPKAKYTDAARHQNVEGAVRLRITLLASGQVGTVTLVKTKGWQRLKKYGLTQQAINAARQIEFTPKIVNGRAVSVVIVRNYTFEVY